MACVHNQAKINKLTQEIKSLQSQIDNLRNNITKTKIIKQKHINFNDKIECVMNNLSGNYVEAGKSYDGGKMLKCLVDSKNTIRDCDSIILESERQIKINERQILSLEQQIAKLDGDCNECEMARYAALTLKEKQQH